MAGFQRAERRRAKARIAITGPSGSGKSMAALLIAKGLGGRVAAIDTENESLSLYADVVPFDTQVLGAPFTPERYIGMIHEAEREGYDIIIIDSLTHEWTGTGGILEIHDTMPGNSWANWSKVTPRHNKLIETILQSPAHIIVTMRSKTEYVQNDKGGKKEIEKVGTAPQQRDGMDYEFTLCLDVQQSHIAGASKDRTSLWNNRYEMITEAHGRELLDWLNKGANAPQASKQSAPPKPQQSNMPSQGDSRREQVARVAQAAGIPMTEIQPWLMANVGKSAVNDLTDDEFIMLIDWLNDSRRK